MTQKPKSWGRELSPRDLKVEVTAVFCLQLLLVSGLVQLDKVLAFGGNLYSFVAVVFVLLPVIVLDRRGKPYARYGIAVKKPLGDVAWTVLAMAVLFPFVVGATHLGFWVLGPWIWGLEDPSFSFAWPVGYPAAAVAHLVVVALPEEFFYRGYIMGRLDDIFPGRIRLLGAEVGWSLLIQAVLFGLGHVLVDFNPARLMVFFSALAFGWLRAKRGTILAPILFHAASNVFMQFFRAGYGLG